MIPTKSGWYRARWPGHTRWSCVSVSMTDDASTSGVYDHGVSRWRPLSDVAEWGPRVDEEAEIASLRRLAGAVADLLGCEAASPGALESMIVELYAMRDRDVDGAKEIESLRAEVERITAEMDALRASGVDWARCIVGLQPEIDSLRAEVERLGAELAAVRVPKSERDEAAPPPGWIVTPRGNVIKNVAGKCDLRHAWAVYDREHGYAPVDAIVDLRAEVERLTVELAATRAPKPERADVFTAGMAAVAAWQQYDREQARRATIAEYDEPCALAEKEPTP